MKTSCEENGLELARREVRAAIPGMADHNELTQADKTAIAAAATQAAQEMVEKTPAASKPGD
jgi:moderate conductance mechanosensitive channel